MKETDFSIDEMTYFQYKEEAWWLAWRGTDPERLKALQKALALYEASKPS